MDCLYINLDSATERRARLEYNFNAIRKPNWNLTRSAAIDTEFIKKNEIRGTAAPRRGARRAVSSATKF